MNVEDLRAMALSFPNTEENPHFDRAAFKITGKKIFATLHEASGSVNLKLSIEDQSAFCTYGKGAIFPIPNKWGLQGWTTFALKSLPKKLMKDALTTAYNEADKAKPKKKR